MNSLKLIEQLSNAYGACGFEDQVVEIAEKFVQDEALGSVRHDCNLNVYITPEKNAGKKPYFSKPRNSSSARLGQNSRALMHTATKLALSFRQSNQTEPCSSFLWAAGPTTPFQLTK